MEFSGKRSRADAPPYQVALARRVVEAVKNPAVRERLRAGAAEWMETADREAESWGKEIRRANRRRGKKETGKRWLGEDAQGTTEYPVPLPHEATEAEKCAVLAAIHDCFPGDVNLGPKSEQGGLNAPTTHEMLILDHITKLDEYDARWLNDFLEGLSAKLGTAGGSRKAAKRGGRKKVDYETEIDEAQILADWKRAHETGVCKADFAKQLGKPFKDLVRLLNRTMRRIARENKRCGQRR